MDNEKYFFFFLSKNHWDLFFSEQLFKYVILGDENVGKSALLIRFAVNI
jgi:GTPase SAR1 family protein